MQGTPLYMAPEVLQQGRLGKPADTWAYGMLLLELVVGRDVGAGLSGVGELGGSLETETAALLPDGCPEGLRALVAACLATQPRLRPSFKQVRQMPQGALSVGCLPSLGGLPDRTDLSTDSQRVVPCLLSYLGR